LITCTSSPRPGTLISCQNGKSDNIYGLLHCQIHNIGHSLPRTGIDDFHAGIAENCGHDTAATIIFIKANFCDEDLNGTLTLLFSHLHIVSGKAVAAFTAEWRN
jgi:hypothetical protein